MAPILKEATTLSEFGPIIDCMWESFQTPFSSVLYLLNPLQSYDEAGYLAAIEASKTRMWKSHENNPCSHWMYICDSENLNEVFSAAHWLIYPESPYDGVEEKRVMDMWPEGEARRFAEFYIGQLIFTSELDAMFTHPSHRCKGHGSLLMKYGMDQAAELKVEAVVESSEEGMKLYKKWGFRTIEKVAIDTITDNPGPIWKKMHSDFGGKNIWWMWKPVEGVYVAGKTQLPWEVRRENRH
ncbi:hypothetical protein CJF30_00010914 [Rutstroemia sp. NJR-2017a BBW]|nr:hypothetical protein CJF30_00010914 [Rutstroemia sp. NJR-2017a BBW]